MVKLTRCSSKRAWYWWIKGNPSDFEHAIDVSLNNSMVVQEYIWKILCPLLWKFWFRWYCLVFMDSSLVHLLFCLYPSRGCRRAEREVLSQLISHIPPFLSTGIDVQCDRPNTQGPASSDCVDLCSAGEKPESHRRVVSVLLPGHRVKPLSIFWHLVTVQSKASILASDVFEMYP